LVCLLQIFRAKALPPCQSSSPWGGIAVHGEGEVYLRIPKRIGHLGDLDVDRGTILEDILKI
jgi:hypothetical protein